MLSPILPLFSQIHTPIQVHFWLHGGIIAKVSPELPLIMVLSTFFVLQFLGTPSHDSGSMFKNLTLLLSTNMILM
jgi:hypothetical protein